MRNILLVILVSILYSCHNVNTNVHELKQLNERITSLENKMDSFTRATHTSPSSINNLGSIWQTSHCAAITKKRNSLQKESKKQ